MIARFFPLGLLSYHQSEFAYPATIPSENVVASSNPVGYELNVSCRACAGASSRSGSLRG